MSCSISLDELSTEQREKISQDLEIKMEQSNYDMGPPKYVYPYEIDNDDVIHLPFAYGFMVTGKKRPDRTTFPPADIKFKGELRDVQKELKKEAVNVLSKKGRVIISAYTGFGKCLKKDTPCLMFDGSIKKVQDIRKNELLMGDDSTPRKVLSTCTGKEQMYDIIPTVGDSFGCNKSHILSLKVCFSQENSNKFEARWFDPVTLKICTKYFAKEKDAETYTDLRAKDVIDIEIGKYLKLPKHVKNILKLYHVPIDFPHADIDIDPYFIGLWLGSDNDKIPCVIVNSKDVKLYLKFFIKDIGLDCTIIGNSYNITSVGKNTLLERMKSYGIIGHKHIPNIYKCNDRNIRLRLLAGLFDSVNSSSYFEIQNINKTLTDDILYLARSLGFVALVKPNSIIFYGEKMDEIPVLIEKNMLYPSGKNSLLSDFKVIPIKEKKYYGFSIDGNRRFLLGDFTVTHNTFCAINIASSIKMKTVIIVHRIILLKQWEASIKLFCPNSVIQKLGAKSVKKDADFYIINAINVPKLGTEFFSDIGTVVVDEAHLIMAEKLSQCMQHLHPRYLIGLTATPYRPDGLNILLDLYFGSYKIIRKLWRKHTVYKIKTGFTPRVELTKNGRVNWNVILDEQATNDKRNDDAVRLMQHFSDRNFIVLTKRIVQATYLMEKLKAKGEKVTSLIGSQQEFDESARILVGTIGKIGVGFDHKKSNALLLAGDVEEYFIQYLGRVFRTEEVEPIIFDMVDKNSILEKHFRTRSQVYKDCGGTVKTFDMSKI